MENDYKRLQLALMDGSYDDFVKIANTANTSSMSNATKMNILHFYVSSASKLQYDAFQIIDYLINTKGIDINEQDGEDLTAVYHSVVNKQKGILNLLIKFKADIEIPDKIGCTPLFRAISSYRGEKELLDIIIVLLDNGASLDKVNTSGVSPKSLINTTGTGIDKNLNPKKWDLRSELKKFLE